MKKNVFIVDVSKLKQDVDFRVVTNTPFYDECTNQFYEIPNHHFDRALLDVLQLGIVKNLLYPNDYYIYNASDDWVGRFGMLDEMLRVLTYHQLTHPHIRDKELEKIVFETKTGLKLLRLLMKGRGEWVVEELKNIYEKD